MARAKSKKRMNGQRVVAGPVAASQGEVMEKIDGEAGKLYHDILAEKKPRMLFPVRALSNVRYVRKNRSEGFFQIKGRKTERTLTVNTVKTFAQSVRTMAQLKDVVATNDIIGKREVYYNAKSWGEVRFDEQPEADTVVDDLEAMFAVNREQFNLIAEERGGNVAGSIVIVDRDPATGSPIDVDCTKLGTAAYSVPSRVEHLAFKTKADFILVVETNQLFERLNHHAFWRDANCIIVSMSGVPTRACRRFVRRLADDKKLPVYVFTDGDPYGYMNIYRTLKVGSGNAAHINEFFCVPQARFLGVTPWDIEEFKLHDATHPLEQVDIKRARDAIKNDPFIQHHKEWRECLEKMLAMGVRVEQQAFAKHSLNYVIQEYLPKKLARPERFLP